MDNGGVYTTIVPPGSYGTQPLSINDLGQIVGYYHDVNDVTHGFLYNHGAYTTLDVPGALSYPLIFSRAKMQLEVGASLRRLSYDES